MLQDSFRCVCYPARWPRISAARRGVSPGIAVPVRDSWDYLPNGTQSRSLTAQTPMEREGNGSMRTSSHSIESRYAMAIAAERLSWSIAGRAAPGPCVPTALPRRSPRTPGDRSGGPKAFRIDPHAQSSCSNPCARCACPVHASAPASRPVTPVFQGASDQAVSAVAKASACKPCSPWLTPKR